MQNLEQIRAKNALNKGSFEGEEKGEVIKKLPAMIRENGLLATVAFAVSKGKDWERAISVIIGHLADPAMPRRLLPAPVAPQAFVGLLANKDAGYLRAVTAEALAYLAYLRRFAE